MEIKQNTLALAQTDLAFVSEVFWIWSLLCFLK